jgi:lipoprotein-releasing system permease protein
MLSTNYKIAYTHLTSSIKQSIIALLGVTFGISVYIFMNSFMSGVNDLQTTLAFTSISHIHIYNDGPVDNTNLVRKAFGFGVLANIRHAKVIQYVQGIKNSADIISLVRKQPEVIAMTPEVNINIFFVNTANKINGTLSGVDVESENKVFGIADYMIAGNWNDLKYNPNGVIIGSGLADKLSLHVSDNINILTPDNISRTYKVIGLFQTNVTQIDKTKAYLNINTARQLLSENQDYLTDLQVDVEDFETTAPLVDRLSPVIPYKVESWQTANQQLEAGSSLRDMIAVAVSLTILMVAGFGIYNIMNMTINEKIREIAILKAMGFSSRDVTTIFLTQALVIGVVGGIVGIGLGYALAVIINHIPFNIAGLGHLPMAYQLKDYIMAFLFGLATTLIAGWLPARKASKIDPVTILRG